jgi:hypothetical protein
MNFFRPGNRVQPPLAGWGIIRFAGLLPGDRAGIF